MCPRKFPKKQVYSYYTLTLFVLPWKSQTIIMVASVLSKKFTYVSSTQFFGVRISQEDFVTVCAEKLEMMSEREAVSRRWNAMHFSRGISCWDDATVSTVTFLVFPHCKPPVTKRLSEKPQELFNQNPWCIMVWSGRWIFLTRLSLSWSHLRPKVASPLVFHSYHSWWFLCGVFGMNPPPTIESDSCLSPNRRNWINSWKNTGFSAYWKRQIVVYSPKN